MRASMLALPLLAAFAVPAAAQDLIIQYDQPTYRAAQPLPAYPGQRVVTLPSFFYTPERIATLVPDTSRKVLYDERAPRGPIIRRSVETYELLSDDPYDYRH